MKAVQFTKYGDVSKNVNIAKIEKPVAGKNEVLIETYAAGVNPIDYKIIEGALKRVRKFKLPATLGHDISGKIVAIGENVTGFNIGDEVFSRVKNMGTFTEFVAVNQNIISLKPKNISFEEAASLPLAGLTAMQSLERGALKANDKILIHAGSGGVGSFAIQYAKSKGAYVYTTTSTANVDWVKALGADRVIDYKTEDYKTIAIDVDMVLDTLGNEYTEDAFSIIKDGGKVITLVGPVDKETAERMGLNKIIRWFLAWNRRKITKLAEQKSAFYSLVFMRPNAKQLNEMTALVEAEKINIKIDKIVALKDTLNALLYVKKGRTKGKVVIKVK